MTSSRIDTSVLGFTVLGGALLGLVLLAGTAAPAAHAGDLIFADGFESGNFSAWSDAVGVTEPPDCIAGPTVSGAFGGDLGPAPGEP